MEAFHAELGKNLDAGIDRAVFLTRPQDAKAAARAVLESPCFGGGFRAVILEADLRPDMPHGQMWDALVAGLLPYLERNKGDTFHIDAALENPVLHATWTMLLYAGQLPQPSKLWVRSGKRDGTWRYRLLTLPVESLNLRLRKASGNAAKARFELERIRSGPLRASLETLVAASRIPSIPVLLLGEKGTGKTRLVEGLLGGVKGKRVHTVLCGALQPELAMSNLFGHVKGAFTGADRDAPGLIGEAAGGILFFDEVQDLPRTVQRMLVRFLQDPDHVYRPVGSSGRELEAHVDVVFASHKSPEELALLLDPDLFDRISLVTVTIPPLRQLREDLPELWRQVWMEHARLDGLAVEPAHPALAAFFASFPFPGNLRDLISLALWIQILYLQSGDVDDALAGAIRRFAAPPEGDSPEESRSAAMRWADEAVPLRQRVNAFRREIVRGALATYGTYAAAARALQVDEKTVRNAMEPENIPE